MIRATLAVLVLAASLSAQCSPCPDDAWDIPLGPFPIGVLVVLVPQQGIPGGCDEEGGHCFPDPAEPCVAGADAFVVVNVADDYTIDVEYSNDGGTNWAPMSSAGGPVPTWREPFVLTAECGQTWKWLIRVRASAPGKPFVFHVHEVYLSCRDCGSPLARREPETIALVPYMVSARPALLAVRMDRTVRVARWLDEPLEAAR